MILLNEQDKKKRLEKIRHIVSVVIQQSFWRKHFENHNFNISTNGFEWDDWEKIPYITKKEMLAIGLDARVFDAQKNINKETMHYLLQSTSGTSKTTGPVLFLKNIDTLVEGPWQNAGERMLIGYQGRAIALRDVIAFIHRNNTSVRNQQALVVNPFRFDKRMIAVLGEFNADSIITFPACIVYMASVVPKIKKILKKLKIGLFSGDFMSGRQYAFTQKEFPHFKIILDYIMTEVDTMGMACSFLRKKQGLNVYHPSNDRLVEIVDIDENGCGEVVITKIIPHNLAVIRYRTGDIAKVFHKTCQCGNEWSFVLQGRSNMDYIKQVGVLITRAEIEKAVKIYEKTIEEWRGEVREKDIKGKLLGELFLRIKLKKHDSFGENRIVQMQEKMSESIYLAPQKTLSALVREGKFLPLKIAIVKELPIEAKKVLLKKVLD